MYLAKNIAKLTPEEIMQAVVSNLKPVELPSDSESDSDSDYEQRLLKKKREMEQKKRDMEREEQERERRFYEEDGRLFRRLRSELLARQAEEGSRTDLVERKVSVSKSRAPKSPFGSNIVIKSTPKNALQVKSFFSVFKQPISMLSAEHREILSSAVKDKFRGDQDLISNLDLLDENFQGNDWYIIFRADTLKVLTKDWRKVVDFYENGVKKFSNQPSLALKAFGYVKDTARAIEERISERYVGKNFEDNCVKEKNPEGFLEIVYPVLELFPNNFIEKLQIAVNGITTKGVLSLDDYFKVLERTVIIKDVMFVQFKARALKLISGWRSGLKVFETELEMESGVTKLEIYAYSFDYMKEVLNELEKKEEKLVREAGLATLTDLAADYASDD